MCGFHTSGEVWGVGLSSQSGVPESVKMLQTASGIGSGGYDSKGTKSVRGVDKAGDQGQRLKVEQAGTGRGRLR